MSEQGPQSVLAVHPGALGDLVLFGRLIESLASPVTLVTGAEKGRLLQGLGVVTRVLDYDVLPMQEVFSDKPLAQCALPALLGHNDRLISCFAAGDSQAQMRLAALCGAENAVFLPVRPAEGSRCHLVELWLDMLGLAFVPKAMRAWPIPPDWRMAAQRELDRLGVVQGEPFWVIHPGSGGVAKCWPLERFMELGRTLKTQRKTRCVFILGPAELDRWPASRVGLLAKHFAVMACPGLTTLAGALGLAQGYIGNDSGVSHLAAATGVATIALFGPSRCEQFAPLGPRVRVVWRGSMEDIEGADVLREVDRVRG